MKFTEEQAEKIFTEFHRIVDNVSYPAIIMIVTDEDTISVANDRMNENINSKKEAYCSGTFCLANALIAHNE